MIALLPMRALVRESVGIAVPLVLVVGSAALLLRALDAIPQFLTGEGRGVLRYESVEGVERVFKDGTFCFQRSFRIRCSGLLPPSVSIPARPPLS